MHPILVEPSSCCIVIRQGTKVWRNLKITAREGTKNYEQHESKSSWRSFWGRPLECNAIWSPTALIFEAQVHKNNFKKRKLDSNIWLGHKPAKEHKHDNILLHQIDHPTHNFITLFWDTFCDTFFCDTHFFVTPIFL